MVVTGVVGVILIFSIAATILSAFVLILVEIPLNKPFVCSVYPASVATLLKYVPILC